MKLTVAERPFSSCPGSAGSAVTGIRIFRPFRGIIRSLFTTIGAPDKAVAPSSAIRLDQMVDDLVKVMDHLGIEKAHLVGHSTGGAIGQTLAVLHPERLISLVIYASWTKADPSSVGCSRRGAPS